MRKGILAQWRRGVAARGLAGALLLAVPVAVAAAIGFGNSFSGITLGLSEIANGPGNPSGPTSTTPSPRRASDAPLVVSAPARGGSGGSGDSGDAGGDGGGGSIGGGAPGGGTGGAGGGGSQPSGNGVPAVTPPGGDGGGDSGDAGGGVVSGVADTVNGLLGGGDDTP